MARVSEESIRKLTAFLDSLPAEAINDGPLCTADLFRIVRQLDGKFYVPKRSGGESNLYIARIYLYPGLVKVGCTTCDPHGRVYSLGAALLHDFELVEHFAFPAPTDISYVEKIVHEAIAAYRVRDNREWFFDSCVPIVENVASIIIDAAEKQIQEKMK